MKLTLLLCLLFTTAVRAQNFSPSATSSSSTLGTTPSASSSLGSPSAIGSDNFNNGSRVPSNGSSTLPQTTQANGGIVPIPGNVNSVIDRGNTAPTSIPGDTTLLNTPSGNPVKQSQEDFNTFPDTTKAPGSTSRPVPGPSTGAGSSAPTGP